MRSKGIIIQDVIVIVGILVSINYLLIFHGTSSNIIFLVSILVVSYCIFHVLTVYRLLKMIRIYL